VLENSRKRPITAANYTRSQKHDTRRILQNTNDTTDQEKKYNMKPTEYGQRTEI
jgi:hypothetical protein